MPNALKTPQPGTDPLSTDVGQFALLLQGLLDAGVLQLAGPQSTPASSSAVASGNSGNLNGAYRWITVLITGWKQGDNSYYVSGFAPSTDSVQVSITNNSANLSSIATGTPVVIGRAVYRTVAGGAVGTEKFAFVIWDNTSTTWTDNTSDANLGTGMPGSGSSPAAYGTAIPASVPTSNTTGTSLSGTIDATTFEGLPQSDYLRTDAGAPNPQTVQNTTVLHGGWLVTGGAGNEAGTGGQIQTFAGYTSPISARTIFGDGTGWKWLISQKSGSTITDLFTFHDNGNFDVSGNATFTGSINSCGFQKINWAPNANVQPVSDQTITLTGLPSSATVFHLAIVTTASNHIVIGNGSNYVDNTSPSSLSLTAVSMYTGTLSLTFHNSNSSVSYTVSNVYGSVM